MIERVEQRHIVATQQAGEHARIDLEARRKGERILAPRELGELLLELEV